MPMFDTEVALVSKAPLDGEIVAFETNVELGAPSKFE